MLWLRQSFYFRGMVGTVKFPLLSKLTAKDLAGKRVFLRTNLDLPTAPDGNMLTDRPLRYVAATCRYLKNAGASVIIAGHMGQPKGRIDPALSLQKLVPLLEKETGSSIEFAHDPTDARTLEQARQMKAGDILLLENLFFWREEEQSASSFAKKLAALADVYVLDSFCLAHRPHASITGMIPLVDKAVFGPHFMAEYDGFKAFWPQASQPRAVIVGGNKVAAKLDTLQTLIPNLEYILIGGNVALTFHAALGLPIGQSYADTSSFDMAREMLHSAGASGCRLILPSDFVVTSPQAGSTPQVVRPREVQPFHNIIDVGPLTLKVWQDKILPSIKTIAWNGPLGFYETNPSCANNQMLRWLNQHKAKSTYLVGSDMLRSTLIAGIDPTTFAAFSSAGGAGLKLLAGQPLVAVDAILATR